MKLYKCLHCGNVVYMASDMKVVPSCCGEPMKELVANTTDAATEKHVPVVEINGNIVTVSVGSVPHPMTEEHHIAWIILETNKGEKIHHLDYTKPAVTSFALEEGEKVIAAYEYCNLHGLWKK